MTGKDAQHDLCMPWGTAATRGVGNVKNCGMKANLLACVLSMLLRPSQAFPLWLQTYRSGGADHPERGDVAGWPRTFSYPC